MTSARAGALVTAGGACPTRPARPASVELPDDGLHSALGEKFGWMPDRVEAAVAQVARIAALVEPSEVVQLIRADPADDRVLEAARAFCADVVVGGDRHLLDLGTWSETEIISPAEFIARSIA